MAEKKKEKITYVDDGSTIADMSGIGGSSFPSGKSGISKIRLGMLHDLKAYFRTFFNTMKLMVLPMLIVIGFITVIFLIAWLIF